MTAQSEPGSHSNFSAIVAMVVSQLSFILNDTLIKLATSELPGGQAIFLRGVFAFLMSFTLAAALGLLRPWPTRSQLPLIAWRNVGEIGSTFFYLMALFHMPIAITTAILQFVPLAIMAVAALFLGEAVGWRRWTAAVVGLIGVLVIIRPGADGFNAWSLVVLMGVFFSVLRDLTTRRITTAIPTMLLVTLSAGIVTLAALSFMTIETWVVPSRRSLLLLCGSAVFLLGGYYFIVEAMRQGEVAVVSPFRYTIMIWAILIGIVVFGERPDMAAIIGSGIVIAAGVYTFMRERKLRLLRARGEHAS